MKVFSPLKSKRGGFFYFENYCIIPEFGVHPSKWVVKNRNSSEKSEL